MVEHRTLTEEYTPFGLMASPEGSRSRSWCKYHGAGPILRFFAKRVLRLCCVVRPTGSPNRSPKPVSFRPWPVSEALPDGDH